jgi:hypothetical protein
VNSPWVLFEAGALTKSLDTSKVIPLLLDLEFSDISGPLAQFQAKKLTKAGVSEVVHSLQVSADDPVPDERSKQLFEALWSELEKRIADIPDSPPSERHVRPQHEVLEELVASVRALDSKVRESEEMIAQLPRSRWGRRSPRMHPMMFMEIDHMLGEGPDDPIGLLVAASIFRDDVPWLYELGMEAYRSMSGPRRRAGAHRDVQRFLRAMERTMHGPFGPEELGLDPRTFEMVMHELPRYLDRFGDGGLRSGPTTQDDESPDE